MTRPYRLVESYAVGGMTSGVGTCIVASYGSRAAADRALARIRQAAPERAAMISIEVRS